MSGRPDNVAIAEAHLEELLAEIEGGREEAERAKRALKQAKKEERGALARAEKAFARGYGDEEAAVEYKVASEAREAAEAELQQAEAEMLSDDEVDAILVDVLGVLTDREVISVLQDLGLKDEEIRELFNELTDEEVDILLAEVGVLEEPPTWGIETEEDGRVIWLQPLYRLASDVYSRISAELRPGSIYLAYLRTIAGSTYMEGEGSPGWVLGEYRGDNISDHWRPFSLGDNSRGRKLTAGRLEAFVDKLTKEQARGYVTGWLVALVPAGNVSKRWLEMRDGAENCVVTAVRAELTRRGRGILSKKAGACLEGFAKRVGRGGAVEEDLHWLCSQLKQRIELLDLEGKVLWGPEKNGKALYQNKGTTPVRIYRSNGHAYYAEKQELPRIMSLVVYDPEGGKQGPKARGPKPELRVDAALAVLEGSEAQRETARAREREQDRAVAALIQDRQLTRVHQVGTEVIDAETGTLYRPLMEDVRLCQEEGCVGEGSDYNLDAEGEPLESLHLGGAQSLAFKKWREAQGLESLPKVQAVREAWRLANFEAVPWSRVEQAPAGSTCVDMRAAYLGCDTREHIAEGKAHEWARRFGFPKGGPQRRARVTKLEEVERLAGCVRFARLELADRVPEAIRQQFAAHLEKDSWLTIPMAVYMYETGLLKAYELEQVVYSVGRLDGLTFPGRDQAVRFVGSCKYSGRKQCFWTRDEAEAEYYVGRYEAHQERADGLYKVTYNTAAERKDHSYVRAYVLSYMFVAMADKLRTLPAEAVLACKVDSITLAAGYEVEGAYGRDYPKWMIPYGAFRVTDVPKPVTMATRECKEAFEAAPHLPAAPLSEDELYQHPLSFLDGQGGTGKTHRALRAFPGRRVVVLGKDNEHLVDLRASEKNPHGYPCYTYHEYFHLGCGSPSAWTPAMMGRTRPDVLVWDEIGCVPVVFLAAALSWLRVVSAVVVLCGDPLGQLQAFDDPGSGKKVMELLAERQAYVVLLETDWRAKDCAALQSLKRRCWRQSEEEQLRLMRGELPLVTEAEMCATWTPADTVVVLTNATGARMDCKLEKERGARYPNEPVRYRFRPTAERRKDLYAKKGGKLKRVRAPDGMMTDAIVGARATAAAGVVPSVPDWVADSWTTLHSLQGKTVSTGRIFIVDEGFGADWCRNAAYTAISRATRFGQLVRVGPPRATAEPYYSTYDLDDVY